VPPAAITDIWRGLFGGSMWPIKNQRCFKKLTASRLDHGIARAQFRHRSIFSRSTTPAMLLYHPLSPVLVGM
jgi:hypothetical protein